MNNFICRLRQEHERRRYLLSALERQLTAVLEGRRADYHLLCDLLDQLSERLVVNRRIYEHPPWDRLARRRPELAAIADELRQRHDRLLAGGERCRQAVENILNDCMVARAAVHQPGLEYANGYRQYMQRKEDAVLAAARVLSPADRNRAGDLLHDSDNEHYARRFGAGNRRGARPRPIRQC